MDQQAQRGRSPSAGHQLPINQSPSLTPTAYPPINDASIGLGLTLDQSNYQTQQAPTSTDFSYGATGFLTPNHQQATFDPTQTLAPSATDGNLAFAGQAQTSPYLAPSNFNDAGDFSLFPVTSQAEPFDQPLFEPSTLNPSDINNMSSPQINHSPTPPHLLKPEPHGSPAFNHHQHFSSPPSSHSRNVSLGPEAALLPNHLSEWSQPQFHTHRRSPSEFSEVSSVAPSPNLVSHDAFESVEGAHSPMQRPQDAGLYQEVLGIGTFSLSDPQHSPNLHGRSPSLSPAISPRILPAQGPDLSHVTGAFGLAHAQNPYGAMPTLQSEAFPNLQPSGDLPQLAPPAINIDYAPTSQRAIFDPLRTRWMPTLSHRLTLETMTAANRRRQSTSAVPNNVIALRLADPEYQNAQDSGNPKRVQKHPATFQCTLCPKRFTRAYNLRSHLRTHTDERPFVCTVCGKAFARQHDRKRHESLHSGEKKFVCKGDLKSGSQWGCGRRFARADALGRHFRSEAGRICIKSLLDEETLERQRLWQEQRMQQNMAHTMVNQGPMIDPTTGFALDPNGGYALPAALLAQYPALAQVNWGAPDMNNPGADDELGGRSSFDASDYDDGDDTGYISGHSGGFGGEGSVSAQGYSEVGYASDYSQGPR
ncbi:unnamed protein product [Parascedosporium putredinis]|uniref:C2H2-type domain-containing protein n=1 Tax=Parascedosporium putredinis TaxID=1442378 RepID=A0A9P1MBH1_9PEZI|nr:unnamed protein product [Parascedosporium putredinis]CAI7998647.1 unnamed protein product [Parascedosporium putredinis]